MNITHKEKQGLSKYLKSLVSGETTPVCLYFGVCHSIDKVFEWPRAKQYYLDIAGLWPGHSGNRYYPVPYNNMAPEEAYEHMRETHINMWNASLTTDPDIIEYINQRYELIRFVIGEIDRELGAV